MMPMLAPGLVGTDLTLITAALSTVPSNRGYQLWRCPSPPTNRTDKHKYKYYVRGYSIWKPS